MNIKKKTIPGIPGIPNIPGIIDSYTTETQKELGPKPKYKKGIQKYQVPFIDHNKRKKKKIFLNYRYYLCLLQTLIRNSELQKYMMPIIDPPLPQKHR